MYNAHAVREADKTLMEILLLQKHIDVFKAEGCGNCCFKNTEMFLRQRDMAIASQHMEIDFSLKEEEVEETIEGVEVL